MDVSTEEWRTAAAHLAFVLTQARSLLARDGVAGRVNLKAKEAIAEYMNLVAKAQDRGEEDPGWWRDDDGE